ncbi:MAG TPA: carboxypeptidase-like regulatory domain-containing protein [Bacteroidales bacterium]|nr:carboxypeptidase-like regulatory domain-containing protein [Bacteroidales bacterium]
MKSLIKNSVNTLALMLILVGITSVQAMGSGWNRERNPQDTAFKVFTGKVIDHTTKKPVVFANVYLVGSSLGTVTNADGEFILKVPTTELNRKLGISNLGYKNLIVDLAELKDRENTFRLEIAATPLEQVVIRSDDPMDLLRMAYRRIPENYNADPEMQVGFYRETVKQNRSYVAVAEAVLDVYKSPYTSLMDYDRVKIFKGRKSEDVKKMDTLMFKLQGGPKTSFLLDVVKNPGEILSEEYFDKYNFKFAGYASIDGRDNYVIQFDQKPEVDIALYKGTVYLDTKNMAISRIDFSFSDKALDIADNELVRKKPMDLKIDVLGADYSINYRVLNEKWYLNHVRSELVFKCDWKKKRFDATYTTALEMAVTDRNTENINKAKYRDQTRMTDIFADKVNAYKDENFWGDYNYIKPEESIESVINKLNKKLRWQNID